MKGLVVAGTASGVGKTVATGAVIRALEQAGLAVQPAKAGPDFIDPSHHEAIADRPSRTLDTWLQGTDGLRRNYHRGEGDVCVVEGVMGLYDGDHSSTARVAEALELPVVLVVDASGGMESIAATALGFDRYASVAGRDITVAGIIAQKAHGGRHEEGIRGALPAELSYFGHVPPRDGLEIPDRHLGLQMDEGAHLDGDVLDAVAANLDVDGLLEVATAPPQPEPTETPPPTDHRVAIARDSAFAFVYPGVLERFRARTEVETFSPVAGDELPDCDGVYLPGGYPELYAEELTESPALETLSGRARDGLPILGECGGFMTLADSLQTVDGETFEMAGILPASVRMHERYQALDHVQYTAERETLTAGSGAVRRGHEFHYSSADVDPDARFAFAMDRGEGIDGERDGLTEYETLGTYSHVHSESGAIDAFIDSLHS